MTRSRDLASLGDNSSKLEQQGLIQVIASSVTKGASGSASVDSKGVVTFSGTESISLNGIFTSTYDNYKVLGNLSLSNTTANLLMRYRDSGTDQSSAYYTGGMVAFTGGAGAFGTGTGATTQTSITLSLNLNNETAVSFSLDVMQPQISDTTPTFGFSKRRNSRIDIVNYNYYFGESYDGFTILPSAGTITGNIQVYGYNK